MSGTSLTIHKVEAVTVGAVHKNGNGFAQEITVHSENHKTSVSFTLFAETRAALAHINVGPDITDHNPGNQV